MVDELQDALSSAGSDRIADMKQEMGLQEAVKEAPVKDEPTEVKEPVEKVEEPETDKAEETISEEAESKTDVQPSKKDYEAKKVARQKAANRRQMETINELKAKVAEFESKGSTPKDTGPKRPAIDEFDDYSEYQKSLDQYEENLIEYKTEQRISEREQKVTLERQQAEEAKRVDDMRNAFEERQTQFKARHKNYDMNAEAVMESVSFLNDENPEAAQLLTRYIATAELGPNLVHHLGQNQHIIDDLSGKGDIEMIVALHELGKSISNEPTKGKKLPEPVDRLKTAQGGGKALNDMGWDELKKNLNL